SDAWQRKYRIRAGVEGTIAQATHVTGIRRARYLGLDKTRLEHSTAAAAINLIRPRRLVDRQAAGPDPDNPPAATRPRSMKPENMTTNKPTGSHQGCNDPRSLLPLRGSQQQSHQARRNRRRPGRSSRVRTLGTQMIRGPLPVGLVALLWRLLG